MKRSLMILLLFLPACLIAGAWTGFGAFNAQGGNAGAMLVSHCASILSTSIIQVASEITEPAGLLILGACLVSAAWLLHRKSRRTGA
jgi:hypothetical protein